VAIANPRQVRAFARAKDKLAKTDPIDAEKLAHFGGAMEPPVRAVRDQQLEEIGQLVTRHRQLIEMLVAERNRRLSRMGTVQHDVDVTIRFLEGRLDKVDRQIKTLIAEHPDWRSKAELLDSVPSVGPVLISSLVAELPELGTLNRKQIAAGGSRAVQQRQRPIARQTAHLGRAKPSAGSALHVSGIGGPL
jgi:transposase